MGVHPVILDLGSVDSPHVQSMAQNELDPLPGTHVDQPIPGESAFHTDDQTFAEGSNCFEKGLLGGG